ncbi:MAG: DUF3108 domain-containing protein [Aquabacterium sp.]
MASRNRLSASLLWWWRRHGPPPLLALAAVLLAHAWLLGLLPQAPARRHADAPAITLRSIVLADARPAQAAPPPAAAEVPAPPAAAPATAALPALAAAASAPWPASAPAMPVPPVTTAPPADPRLRQPTVADRQQAAQTDADGEPLPLYATRLPAPALLHYTLQMGVLNGEAALHWKPDGETYELLLEGRAFGRPMIEQVSRGVLADVGVAPERFTDRRRGRGGQAANFQREGGRVTFSGARVDFLLPPGAQDRLSVLVQVAAVASAWGRPPVAGEQITLWVVDARGTAGTWRFQVEAEEDIELPAGPARTWRLARVPRHADDPGMTLWLDPARHWWPVRLRQGRPRGSEYVYELNLSAIESGR